MFMFLLGFVLILWTNLALIKFVFLFCVFALVSLFCVCLCRYLHSRSQLWKEVIAKKKNPWLMLITSPQSQRRLNHQQDFMIPTSSDQMLHFNPMRVILKMLCCWLKGLLTKRLFLRRTSLNGLPPRIRTTFLPTLMIHTRKWWKSFMQMPFLKGMSKMLG